MQMLYWIPPYAPSGDSIQAEFGQTEICAELTDQLLLLSESFWIWGINFSPWQIGRAKNIEAVESMDCKDDQSAQGQITRILLDFLEVAITSIVFHKGIYPSVIFFDSDGTPLERYAFKIQVNQAYGSKVDESDLVFSLRSFLVKLSVSKAVSSVLPKVIFGASEFV
ncbi:hypothetical protein Cgig2_016368 [Carnegiea gigantea]|uniref:HORMA domain-containing protein n=1 Tax=Carnegiea gigantea TaxID=171969 RepID=A0A9Q1JX46_9CARY|nr:hypothetical protein Cgig2_016368 [Carnegiea gigantea]